MSVNMQILAVKGAAYEMHMLTYATSEQNLYLVGVPLHVLLYWCMCDIFMQQVLLLANIHIICLFL